METSGATEPVAAERETLTADERPNYSPPPRLLARVVWDVLWKRRRAIGADCARVAARMNPPTVREGLDHIPASGPLVLLTNHYERPGLWVGFGAIAAIAAVVERRPDLADAFYAVAIGGWHAGRVGRVPVPDALTRWAFGRAAHTYGLILIPPNRADTAAQAVAVRHALRLMRDKPQARALFLSPEGDVGDGLIEARPGVGAFMLLVSRVGVPLLPCAFGDEGGRLVVRFGPPFQPREQRDAAHAYQDRAARDEMMLRIGRLLPPARWGFYRDLLTRDKETHA